MNKEIEGKEMYNHLKHLIVNDVRFSIVQVKTRRTQRISIIRWLTEEQTKELEPVLNGDDGILVRRNCANTREAIRAIERESVSNRKLKAYMTWKEDVLKDLVKNE